MERRSFIPVAKRELRIRLKCDAASSSRCASDVGLVGWKTSRRAIGQFFSHLPLHFSQSDLRCATSLMSCSCFTSSSSICVRCRQHPALPLVHQGQVPPVPLVPLLPAVPLLPDDDAHVEKCRENVDKEQLSQMTMCNDQPTR